MVGNRSAQTELATLNERVDATKTKVTELEQTVKVLTTDVDGLKSLVNRVKGGIATILALGAIIGWVSSTLGPWVLKLISG